MEPFTWSAAAATTDGPEGFDVPEALAVAGERELVAGEFVDVYRSQYRRVLALAIALTGSRATAEDLVQVAFADAHRRWAHIARYDRPEAWLRRAVTSRAVSRRRRWVTAQRASNRLGIASAVGLEPRDAELWERVRRLPPRQAQLVALVFVGGLSIKGAAEVLGVASTTAATHLSRAKERLQRELSDWKDER